MGVVKLDTGCTHLKDFACSGSSDGSGCWDHELTGFNSSNRSDLQGACVLMA